MIGSICIFSEREMDLYDYNPVSMIRKFVQ